MINDSNNSAHVDNLAVNTAIPAIAIFMYFLKYSNIEIDLIMIFGMYVCKDATLPNVEMYFKIYYTYYYTYFLHTTNILHI